MILFSDSKLKLMNFLAKDEQNSIFKIEGYVADYVFILVEFYMKQSIEENEINNKIT